MKKEKPQNKTLKTDNEVKETVITESKTVSKEVEVPNLEVDKIYEFVANGTFRTLPKGSVWSVTGETAMIFLKKGYGKLK
jgi:hypothetical protein